MIVPMTTLALVVLGIVSAQLTLNMVLRFVHRFGGQIVAPAGYDVRIVAAAIDQKTSALRGWHLELEKDLRSSRDRRSPRRRSSMLLIERRLPLQLVSNAVGSDAGV
jgi:hypothetical protein